MLPLLLSLLLSFSPTADQSKVAWLSPTTHDFGDLPQGRPVRVDFRFQNTSADSLRIDNVRTTCGCTAPDWSDDAVAPGAEGLINIEFDAEKLGYFEKKITVYFSDQRKAEKLYITGYVE